MNTKRSPELHLNENMAFQRHQWLAERLGWILIALIILAGLIGVFGSGPLSRAQLGTSDTLELQYERFIRHEQGTDLKITLGPAAIVDGEARVLIDRDYLSAFQVERITPEPERMQPTGKSILLAFPVKDTNTVEIILNLRPDELGRHSGPVSIPGAEPIMLTQFTYP